MTNIEVNRQQSGEIIHITRTVSRSQNLEALIIFGLFTAGLVGDLFSPGPKPLFTTAYLAVLALMGIGASLFFLKRLLSPTPRKLEIANTLGILLLYYPELGLVPWSEVKQFEIRYEAIPGQGNAQLVATLRDPAKYIAKLKSSNRFTPGRRYAPVFACIAGSRFIDLVKLCALLDEAKQQHNNIA